MSIGQNIGNLANKAPTTLPEFQTFLKDRRLVPDKNVPYLAYWVSRYLHYALTRDIDAATYLEASVLEFLENMRADSRFKDWQVRQATDALQLYYFHFRGNTAHGGDKPAYPDVQSVLKELNRMIRLRHYSYATERTYLHWSKLFLSYAMSNRHKQLAEIDAADFRDFLSHLALKVRVSSSTQNQAFNAVLFLFRNVLRVNPEGLQDSVRAKRGIKVPVVFSVEETRRLFEQMDGLSRLFAEMLYGSGMRIMEGMRLRVKDVDFDADTIFVRSGKGDKDRSTVLPLSVKDRLREHLKEVKSLHDKDLSLRSTHGAGRWGGII
ncbi:MAG: hypothetical protein OHK006_11860 [Thermodesulfovibrionales bacterium]